MEVVKTDVIIVGAGAAGVCTSKEMAEQGVDSLCFDRAASVGGVFTRVAYPDMKFTSSTNTTQFSDFPWKGGMAHHWTPIESLKYLDAYVDHFGIRDRFRLQCQVNKLEKLEVEEDGYRWKATVEYKNWERHWTQDEMSKDYEIEHRVETVLCKFLCLACGAHGKPRIPKIPGLEETDALVLHSTEYCRSKEKVRGKKVVQLGLGESGSDIALSISQVAEHLKVSIRRYPYHSGVYFPKVWENGSADQFDSRMYYSLNRELNANIFKLGLDSRFGGHSGPQEKQNLFRQAMYFNTQMAEPDLGVRSPFNSFGVKNLNFMKAMHRYGADLKPGIERIEGKTIHYADGSSYETDAIVFCTGYHPRFDFLPEEYQKVVCCDKLRDWWKHVAHPDLGDDLMLCGFARPNMTSFWITIELNARFIAACAAGKCKLPSADEMRAVAKKDKDFYLKNFGYTGRNINALIDHHYYCENFAEYMNSTPPYFWLFITLDWWVLVKLFWASLNGSHYRMTGPNAKFDVARDTLVNWTPFYPCNGILDYLQGFQAQHFGLIAFQGISFLLAPLGFGPIGTLHRFVYIFWAFYLTGMYFFGWYAAVVPFVVIVLSFCTAFVISKLSLSHFWDPYFTPSPRPEYYTY